MCRNSVTRSSQKQSPRAGDLTSPACSLWNQGVNTQPDLICCQRLFSNTTAEKERCKAEEERDPKQAEQAEELEHNEHVTHSDI